MPLGIRDRTRELLRSQLADAVLTVFLERGYAAVTVEEAAHEAGISRATFFRYFGSKEDVVVASMGSNKVDYHAAVGRLPSTAVITSWQLVRAAVEPAVVAATSEPEELRPRLRLILSEPALKARLQERRAENADLLTSALVDRLDDSLTARVLAVAGLAALDVAWETWAGDDHADFRKIVDTIFQHLEQA